MGFSLKVVAGTVAAVATKSEHSEADDVNSSFFGALVRAETRLYNALGERLRERCGIPTSRYESLHYLRTHEAAGARVADLAAEFAVGVGAMSKAVDRMEREGVAERRPNPADRRSALLALTPAGRDLADAADAVFREYLAELLATAGLTADQVAEAGRVLGQLRTTLESAGLGLPTG